MTFRGSLWKIPTDFTKKVDLPELGYAEQYLKEQKNIIQQLDDTLSALEKSYRSQANTFNTSSPIPSSIRCSTPEAALLHHFAETRTVLAARFSNYAVQLSTLRTSRLSPLRDGFNFHSKTISAELGRLRSILADPIEKVGTVCKAHEKLIGALSGLCIKAGRSPTAPPNLQRAVAEFDDRLDKANIQYLQFRSKFMEYCRARDPLFEQIDTLATETAKGLRAIIADAWAIDEAVVGAEKRDQFVERPASFLPNFATDDEPVRPAGNFRVTIDRPVEVAPSRTITGDDTYVLVDASGDDWQIRDAAGNVWSVPAECIVPMPK
jgi:hypothetical protein